MAKSSITSTSRGGAARRFWTLAAAASCVAAAGCAKSPYDLAPTGGTVTIDGQPFTQGKVMFAPIAKGESRESGRPAFGRLGADGSFQLSTYDEGDGAVVGEHWVTVIHIPPKEGAGTPTAAGAPAFSRVAVPRKATVAAGEENRVVIQLTRQEVAQYGVFDD